MERTIVGQLKPTPEQAAVLHRTIDEHTACFNAVCREGFSSKYSNGVELHKRTYYNQRALYPDLPAQLICAARVKATEAVKSALTWEKRHAAEYPKKVAKALKKGKPIPTFKPVRSPQSPCCCIRYAHVMRNEMRQQARSVRYLVDKRGNPCKTGKNVSP